MAQSRRQPASYVDENGQFPHGPFKPDTPQEVYLAAGLAFRLKYSSRRYSIRYIAKKAGLSPQTVLNILNGKSWPDLRTIARLEIVFDYQLWGYDHRRPPEDFYLNHGIGTRNYPKSPRDYQTIQSRLRRKGKTEQP